MLSATDNYLMALLLQIGLVLTCVRFLGHSVCNYAAVPALF